MVTLLLKVYLCWPTCPGAVLQDWVREYPSPNTRSSSPAIFFDILDLFHSDLCLSGVLEFSLLTILAIWLLSFVLFLGFLFDVLSSLFCPLIFSHLPWNGKFCSLSSWLYSYDLDLFIVNTCTSNAKVTYYHILICYTIEQRSLNVLSSTFRLHNQYGLYMIVSVYVFQQPSTANH